MKQIRVARIVIAAVAAELLAVIALVMVVALFGPSDADAAQAFAERLGYWFGPIAGFVLCLLGGSWVARGLHAAQVLNGLVLGLVVAGIDIGILVASGAAFQPVFVVSNIGRVIAGTAGGWVARRLASTSSQEASS